MKGGLGALSGDFHAAGGEKRRKQNKTKNIREGGMPLTVAGLLFCQVRRDEGVKETGVLPNNTLLSNVEDI